MYAMARTHVSSGSTPTCSTDTQLLTMTTPTALQQAAFRRWHRPPRNKPPRGKAVVKAVKTMTQGAVSQKEMSQCVEVLAAVAGIVKIPGIVKGLQKLATMSKKEMFGKVRRKRRIGRTGWMESVSEQTPSGAKVLPLAALGARWSGMGDDEKQKYKDRALAARIKKPDWPAAEAFNEIETPAAVNKQEPVCFIT